MSEKRVLVIGTSQKGALSQSYGRAFERLGLKVIHFDSERAMMQASRFSGNRFLRRALRSKLWSFANRETLAVVRSTRPDLVFAVKCAFLSPETVRQMRNAAAAPVVNYYPDNPYVGVHWVQKRGSAQRHNLVEVLRQYDVIWIWDLSLVRGLREDGVRAEYLPFASDPEMYRSESSSEPLFCSSCGSPHRVVFVATCSRSRQREMSSIRKHPVAIWGNGWPSQSRTPLLNRLHPAAGPQEASRIYASAEVSLNVLNPENLEGHNMRTFEVPASGGVLLARYTTAQDKFFPENEAAVYYRSPDEIDGKIDALLQDGTFRERLRRNAATLAATQTYDHRAAEILRYVGLARDVFSTRTVGTGK